MTDVNVIDSTGRVEVCPSQSRVIVEPLSKEVVLLTVDSAPQASSFEQIVEVFVNPQTYPTITVVGEQGPAGLGGGSTEFDPKPDLRDKLNATHYYMGWISINGSWRVRREVWGELDHEDALIAGNGSHADLTSAWSDRTNLIYT